MAAKDKVIDRFRSTLERLKRGGGAALASPSHHISAATPITTTRHTAAGGHGHRDQDEDNEGDEQPDNNNNNNHSSSNNNANDRRTTLPSLSSKLPISHDAKHIPPQSSSAPVILPSLTDGRARSAPPPLHHQHQQHQGHAPLVQEAWRPTGAVGNGNGTVVGLPPSTVDELWVKYMPTFVGLCKSQLEAAINTNSVHALQQLFDSDQSYFDQIAERYPLLCSNFMI
jgi:hypothetical protein